MSKINYNDKQFLYQNADVPAENKVNDVDMNEIKQVVNENDNKVGELNNLNTTDKSNVINAINEIFNNLELIPITIGSLPTGTNYNAFYIPKLKMCYANIYVNSGGITAGSTTNLGTVQEEYKPSMASALSVYRGLTGGYQASINTSGIIRFFSEKALQSGSKFIISGVWFVA